MSGDTTATTWGCLLSSCHIVKQSTSRDRVPWRSCTQQYMACEVTTKQCLPLCSHCLVPGTRRSLISLSCHTIMAKPDRYLHKHAKEDNKSARDSQGTAHPTEAQSTLHDESNPEPAIMQPVVAALLVFAVWFGGKVCSMLCIPARVQVAMCHCD